MKINIISVGNKAPLWVKQGYEEYIKRLKGEFTINSIEIPMAKRTRGAILDRLIQVEGEQILASIGRYDWVVALTEQGQLWNTQELSAQLQIWRNQGHSLSFMIGGPDGFSTQVLARAQQHWALSPLTFPHLIVRILLAEQLYRAYSILCQHPYHRS